MTKQPEALHIANSIENAKSTPELTLAAAFAVMELRRLHEVNAELLKALQGLMHDWTTPTEYRDAAKAARASIAKATGETE